MVSMSSVFYSNFKIHFSPECNVDEFFSFISDRMFSMALAKNYPTPLLFVCLFFPCSLSALSEFNISTNDLVEIPSTIGLLRNLRTMYADENYLEVIPPEVWKDFLNLNFLYLCWWKLLWSHSSRVLKRFFKSKFYLSILMKITLVIPPEVWKDFLKLDFIYAHENQL